MSAAHNSYAVQSIELYKLVSSDVVRQVLQERMISDAKRKSGIHVDCITMWNFWVDEG